MSRKRGFLRRYALGILLGVGFALSWYLQFATHSETMKDFWNATAENWQSEFLQLLAFVVLSRWFIFEGSPQSRDGSDKMQADLDEIKARQISILARLERKD